MDEEARLLERAVNAAKTCLLPPLQFDFDMKPLTADSFKEFKIMLDDNLQLLLDILFRNRIFLERKTENTDKELVELREKLLLLTYEQTEAPELFQCELENQVKALDQLIKLNFKHFGQIEIRRVVATYKENLTNDGWKRQLGMIYGFPKFCNEVLSLKQIFVDSDLLLFILSVGSKLVSHYDPQYKTLGLKIYHNLLQLGAEDLLRTFNIHEVVYNECSNMIRKNDELVYNDLLYECLLKVIQMEDAEVVNAKWCKFDCVFGPLLEHLGTQSEAELSLLLVEKIVKFCVVTYGSSNINLEATEQKYFDELKETCRAENLRTMRWTRKLMDTMVRELPKLTGKDKAKYLNAFHSIYIASFANSEKSVLGRPLTDFTKKLTKHLLMVAKQFENEKPFLNSVKSMLSTINDHQTDEKFQQGLAVVLRSFS